MPIAGAVGSFLDREGAAVQPANVARGLARTVERRGGTIYEQTRVTHHTPRATANATGRGYVGEGVATANLSGRVLADLITETDSELTRLPMTRHISKRWEPEPLRWLGVTFVRRSRQKTIAEVERTGKVREQPTLAQRIWDL